MIDEVALNRDATVDKFLDIHAHDRPRHFHQPEREVIGPGKLWKTMPA
jgi:hypothetical protein